MSVSKLTSNQRIRLLELSMTQLVRKILDLIVRVEYLETAEGPDRAEFIRKVMGDDSDNAPEFVE